MERFGLILTILAIFLASCEEGFKDRGIDIEGRWEINLNYYCYPNSSDVKQGNFIITITYFTECGDWKGFTWYSNGNIPNSEYNHGWGLAEGTAELANIYFWTEDSQGNHIDNFFVNYSRTPESNWDKGNYSRVFGNQTCSGNFSAIKR